MDAESIGSDWNQIGLGPDYKIGHVAAFDHPDSVDSCTSFDIAQGYVRPERGENVAGALSPRCTAVIDVEWDARAAAALLENVAFRLAIALRTGNAV